MYAQLVGILHVHVYVYISLRNVELSMRIGLHLWW